MDDFRFGLHFSTCVREKQAERGLRAATSPVTWSVSRVGLSRVLYSWGIATFRRNCVVSSRRPTGVALWRQRISCGLVSTAIKSETNQPIMEDKSALFFFTLFFCCLFIAITTAGLIGNTLLLLTTIRSLSLRSPCNILIGSCALFDVLHQSALYVPAYGIISQVTMRSITCSMIMNLGWQEAPSHFYALVLTDSSPFFRPIVIDAQIRENIFSEQICGINLVFHDKALFYWTYMGVAVNLTAFAFYMMTWRIISSKSENLEIEQLRRIFRTIMLVTTLELGGFTITQLIMSVQQRFELSAQNIGKRSKA
ncbi:hypothetical protein PRIPAC_82304 [Pristionchus pacificus]|uniref:G protein-coupled receptor n=1 Tax=Pristionchus pacificus TaxID=54126 RepID=A0A2A6CKU1_PRIPA|nr:hypothetical protein PRIPAC_82304 [Pristionchus pacificus]|eukprot:PDM78834.1 G protein-coupled receptor [Pristionchus pacificus]